MKTKPVPPVRYPGASTLIQVKIKAAEAQQLEAWAESIGRTRSEVLRGLVRKALEQPSTDLLGRTAP